MSLLDGVRSIYLRQAHKHDLWQRYHASPEDYADAQINEMTNAELLMAIDSFLEERREARAAAKTGVKP